jgi:hypothetical protein
VGQNQNPDGRLGIYELKNKFPKISEIAFNAGGTK